MVVVERFVVVVEGFVVVVIEVWWLLLRCGGCYGDNSEMSFNGCGEVEEWWPLKVGR